MPDTILDDIQMLKAGFTDLSTRLDRLESTPAIPPAITNDQLIQALRTMLLGGAASAPIAAASTSVPAPVTSVFTGMEAGTVRDVNAYPLDVPAVANGADMVLGVGKNTLELKVASSPSAAADASQICYINVIFVRPDGTKQGVAADIPVTSFAGEGNPKQSIKIKGPWGSNPQFLITGSTKGAGTGGLFIGGADIDLVPLGITGKVNYAGAIVHGEPNSYISVADTTLTLSQTSNAPPVATPAPTPAPADTIFPNGKTLADTISGAGPVGVMTLPAGVIVGTSALAVSLAGQGGGVTTLDLANHPLTYTKAALVPTVPGLIFSKMSVKNCRLGDGQGANGAAVRDAGPGIGFTLEDFEISDCDNGILTFDGDYVLNRVKITGCGSPLPSGAGRTHNIYVGGGTLTMTDYVGAGAVVGHDIKTRAKVNTLARVNSTMGGNGRSLDVCDGGQVSVTDSVFTCPAGADTRVFFGFATESTKNGAGGTITFVNHLFDDQSGKGCYIVTGDPTAKLVLINCKYKGVKPTFQGWGDGMITGDILPA